MEKDNKKFVVSNSYYSFSFISENKNNLNDVSFKFKAKLLILVKYFKFIISLHYTLDTEYKTDFLTSNNLSRILLNWHCINYVPQYVVNIQTLKVTENIQQYFGKLNAWIKFNLRPKYWRRLKSKQMQTVPWLYVSSLTTKLVSSFILGLIPTTILFSFKIYVNSKIKYCWRFENFLLL